MEGVCQDMVSVVKADGRKEIFARGKIIRSSLRMGASPELAEAIADRIEERVYEGIPTGRILQMLYTYMERYRPVLKNQIDLRRAISLLKSKPDFEWYVQLLLEAEGYRVLANQVLRGRCVEYEIDAIASGRGETLYVEVKHHKKHHTTTDLTVPLETRAKLEDLSEGYRLGLNNISFNRALIICNTKFTEHAKRYSECVGIGHIGWNTPPDRGLETRIEEKKLYPITILRELQNHEKEHLCNLGIITLQKLIDQDLKDLVERTGLKEDRLRLLRKASEEILAV
jgi:Holliday junction resolvase-like predicted endonuclease